MLVLLVLSFMPINSLADNDYQTVRVGWYSVKGLMETDNAGNRSGLVYECLQDISAINNWKYTYIPCSEEEAVKMLQSGKVDLICGVEKTGAEDGILFSKSPMISEPAYVYYRADSELDSNVYGLNNSVVALYGNGMFNTYYTNLIESKNIETNDVFYSDVDHAMSAVDKGEADAIVSRDMVIGKGYYPAIYLGTTYYYFATSDNTPWVKEKIDSAMNRIAAIDSGYWPNLYDEYFKNGQIEKLALTPSDISWINNKQCLIVGWSESFNPMIYEKDGVASGALVNYINKVAKCVGLETKYVKFSDDNALKKALDKGNIDIFPYSYVNLTTAENEGHSQSHTYYECRFVIVTDNTDTVAINNLAYNKNYSLDYVSSVYPSAKLNAFDDDEECVNAVLEGKCDTALVEEYSAKVLLNYSKYSELVYLRIAQTYPICFEMIADGSPLKTILDIAIEKNNSNKIDIETSEIVAESTARSAVIDESSNQRTIMINAATCLVVLIGLIIYSAFAADGQSKGTNAMILVCAVAVLWIASKFGNGVLNGEIGNTAFIANKICSAAAILSPPIMIIAIAVLTTRTVHGRKKIKVLPHISSVVSTIAVLTGIVSWFDYSVWYVSISNNLILGRYYSVYLLLMFISTALLIAYEICNRDVFVGKETASFVILIVTPLIALLESYFFPTLDLTSTIIVSGTGLAFLGLQSRVLKSGQIEVMTQLSELSGIYKTFAGVYKWDVEKKQMHCTMVERRYSGLLDESVLNVDRFVEEYVYPDDKRSVKEFISEVNFSNMYNSQTKYSRELEYRELCADGIEWRRISLSFFPASELETESLYIIFSNTNYEKQAIEKTETREKKLIQSTTEQFYEIYEYDFSTDVAIRLYFDDGMLKESIVPENWNERLVNFAREKVLPDDMDSYDKVLPKKIRELDVGSTVSCVFRAKEDGRNYRWYSLTVKIISYGNNGKAALYLQKDLEDVVGRHDYLKSRSDHDGKTDLFSRSKLESMKSYEYTNLKSCGIIYFDIDNLSKINGAYSMEIGDGVLMMLAESVRSITSRRALAYRFAGDEVVVVVTNATKNEMTQLIEMWKARHEYLNDHAKIKCEVSYGTSWADGTFTVEELIQLAKSRISTVKK